MPRREFTEGAPELVAWCVGQTVGSITVLAAEFTADIDHDGEAVVYIDLTITDPPAWNETWPVDDVMALRMKVNEKAADLLTADRWSVRMRAATPWLVRRAAETG